MLWIKRMIPRRLKRMIKALLGRDLFLPVQLRLPSAFHGSSYGGWSVCPSGLSAGSVVYSFGVGSDATFDQSLIETYGLQVYAFDPTPSSIEWVRTQAWPAQFHFFPYGIAAHDEEIKFYPPRELTHGSHTVITGMVDERRAIVVPVRRLSSIVRELGHSQIDILKMDIEGAEYSVIEDLLAGDIRPTQLLVEFHHRFPPIGARKTRAAVRLLNQAGYRIFAVSATGEELSFIWEQQAAVSEL